MSLDNIPSSGNQGGGGWKIVASLSALDTVPERGVVGVLRASSRAAFRF